jgi:hypothetical protein
MERSVACYYCFVVEALIDNREEISRRGGVVGSTVVDGEEKEKREGKNVYSHLFNLSH